MSEETVVSFGDYRMVTSDGYEGYRFRGSDGRFVGRGDLPFIPNFRTIYHYGYVTRESKYRFDGEIKVWYITNVPHSTAEVRAEFDRVENESGMARMFPRRIEVTAEENELVDNDEVSKSPRPASGKPQSGVHVRRGEIQHRIWFKDGGWGYTLDEL